MDSDLSIETKLRYIVSFWGCYSLQYLITRLVELGVKGEKCLPNCCPIANALKKMTGAERVCVGLRNIYASCDGKYVQLRTPVIFLELMREIDWGKLPELTNA